MGALEKYFGIEKTKKLSDAKAEHRSKKYLAKLEETQIMKQVNDLYVKGQSGQCFSLLEKAVKLVPNDPGPFYMLGLIHEENMRFEKALVAYTAAAILKKNDISMWKKVLDLSVHARNDRQKVLAIEKIYRREPKEALLLQKMEILKKMNKKYSVIACQIELFDYNGVDQRIFEKFKHTHHNNSLRVICSKLYKCIRKNREAQSMSFLCNSIETFYKIKDWQGIIKILDDFYFQQGFQATPSIRIIYFIASMNLNEGRYDSLLDFSKLLNDDAFWNGIAKHDYVFDLAGLFRSQDNLEKAIGLLERLLRSQHSLQALEILGDYYSEVGQADKALGFYRQVITENPVNEQVKTKIYKIYKDLGNEEMLKEYEVPSKVQNYIASVENIDKEPHRYSPDKCSAMQNIFDDSLPVLDEDLGQYYDCVKPLLDDFFANPFVILKNKNFRVFQNKNEKIRVEQVVPYDEKYSMKQMAEKAIRISALHGLDVDEWLFVAKNSVFSLICNCRFSEAWNLLKKIMEAEIFKNSSDRMSQFLFLGIRIGLMLNDMEVITNIISKMTYLYDHSAIYLLYAIAHLFPNFQFSRSFSDLQKNIQRIARRFGGHELVPFQPKDPHDSEARSCPDAKPHRVTEHMGLCSFLPRFLQTETVDFVNTYKKSNTLVSNLVSGIINLTHAKSRRLEDKKVYASKGIAYIKQIECETPSVKDYNLAKAYHFFGYYDLAEQFYLRVVEHGAEDLRRMAIFNLSIIFRRNKSKNVLLALLSKAAKNCD